MSNKSVRSISQNRDYITTRDRVNLERLNEDIKINAINRSGLVLPSILIVSSNVTLNNGSQLTTYDIPNDYEFPESNRSNKDTTRIEVFNNSRLSLPLSQLVFVQSIELTNDSSLLVYPDGISEIEMARLGGYVDAQMNSIRHQAQASDRSSGIA